MINIIISYLFISAIAAFIMMMAYKRWFRGAPAYAADVFECIIVFFIYLFAWPYFIYLIARESLRKRFFKK